MSDLYKYTLISYTGELVTDCYVFESEHRGLNIDSCNNENVPIAVGSNQSIVSWDDSPIYEAECALCGNRGVCREYFKVDLEEDIMDALLEGRYGNPFCINTCYKKIDALMHTDHGSF